MMKLISICISLFLVFSPLYGQTNRDGRVMTQKEYERMDKWNIQITEEGSFFDVALWNIIGDSLVIGDIETKRTIYIGSIVRISATKETYSGGKGAAIKFNAGALIGIALVFLIVSNCKDPDFASNCVPVGFLSVGIGALFQNEFKKRKVYDMSGWSIEEKKAILQEIMNSE